MSLLSSPKLWLEAFRVFTGDPSIENVKTAEEQIFVPNMIEEVVVTPPDSTITTTDGIVAHFQNIIKKISLDLDSALYKDFQKWRNIDKEVNYTPHEQHQFHKYIGACINRSKNPEELTSRIKIAVGYLLNAQIQEKNNPKEKSVKEKIKMLQDPNLLGDIATVEIFHNPPNAKKLIIIFPDKHSQKKECEKIQNQMSASWQRIADKGISDVFLHEGMSAKEITNDTILPYYFEITPKDTIDNYEYGTFRRFEDHNPDIQNFGLETYEIKKTSAEKQDMFEFFDQFNQRIQLLNTAFPIRKKEYISMIRDFTFTKYNPEYHRFEKKDFIRYCKNFMSKIDTISVETHQALFHHIESEMLEWVYTKRTQEAHTPNIFNVLDGVQKNTGVASLGVDHVYPLLKYGKSTLTLPETIKAQHPDAAIAIVSVNELKSVLDMYK